MISSSDILHGKILIVDDQEADVLLLERILRGAGYTSITSEMNPRDVSDLHRENHYDLILLDLHMPSMDGFLVMDELKEFEPQDTLLELPMKHQFQMREGLEEIVPGSYLPVIVITAHPSYKLRALKAGAQDFISKPFEVAEVLARVHNMLEVRLLHVETKIYIKALEQKIMETEGRRERISSQSREAKHSNDHIVPVQGREPAVLAQRAARSCTVLFIEDNPADMKLVEKIIMRHPDMHLLTAVNGRSGMEIACSSLPDLILMDINLPDISGYKALKLLRSVPATAHIPVIAISANTLPINIKSGIEEGFFRYITKPIRVDEFMAAVEMALQISRKSMATAK